MWLNALPNDSSIYDELSPREMVIGTPTDFITDCRIEFGTYCQIYENPNITNTQETRSRDAIALGPSGNRQGSYKFLTLDTWEVVLRGKRTELSMPKSIIDVIESKAKSEGQKKIPRHNNLLFEWRPNNPIHPHYDTILNESYSSNDDASTNDNSTVDDNDLTDTDDNTVQSDSSDAEDDNSENNISLETDDNPIEENDPSILIRDHRH